MQIIMNQKCLNYVYIVLAATLWGLMGVFVKCLGSLGLHTVQIALLRALISMLFIGCLIICRDPSLFRIKLCDIWMFLGTGIVSYFLFNICYFTSIKENGVAISSVLLYTCPIFVTLMACIFFGEKMTPVKAVCLLLAVSGCALVSGLASGDVRNITFYGVFMGLASAFTYSLYSIISTFALRKYKPITVTFYTFFFGSIAAFIVGRPIDTFVTICTPPGIMWSLALGVFSGALPYFLYTKGLSGVEASYASVVSTIEPVVASLIGIFLYHEPSDFFTIFGICLIILASIVLNFRRVTATKGNARK